MSHIATVAATRTTATRYPTRLPGSRRRHITVVVLLLLAVLTISACQSQQGTVSGTFSLVGGPPPGIHPIAGQVTLTDSQGNSTVVNVPASGTFSVQVAPGTYHVYWTTNQVQGGNGGIPCVSTPSTITVTAGATVRVAIRCDVH